MQVPFDPAFLAILIGLPYAIVIVRFLQVRGAVSRQPAPVRGAVPFRTLQRRGGPDGTYGEPLASSGGARRRGSGPIAMRIAAR